jgi:ribosomal-protein-alanine N-acetyltransferase
MNWLGYLEQIKDFVIYDADREFYAKIFPGSVGRIDLLRMRRMRLADIDDVLDIEQQVYNFPWSEGIFKDCFTAGYDCWVCEELDNILGYCMISMASGEAHIMNICVDPAEQKQGIGRFMIEHLLKFASDYKVASIFLEVRPSNAAAIALYTGLGFNEIGIRKDYYPGEEGREDALMLAKELLVL